MDFELTTLLFAQNDAPVAAEAAATEATAPVAEEVAATAETEVVEMADVAETTTTAQQPAPTGEEPGFLGSLLGSPIVMIILIFVVMWLFMIRPQRKQQKEQEKMRAGLKKGDKVVSAGGIYGTIDEVDDKTILVKVDGDVKLRFDRNTLTKISE